MCNYIFYFSHNFYLFSFIYHKLTSLITILIWFTFCLQFDWTLAKVCFVWVYFHGSWETALEMFLSWISCAFYIYRSILVGSAGRDKEKSDAFFQIGINLYVWRWIGLAHIFSSHFDVYTFSHTLPQTNSKIWCRQR